MTPKKVVLVGPAKPYRGGIAQFTDGLANGLRKRGHTVDVISFSRQYPKIFFPGTSQLEPRGDMDSAGTSALIDSVNPISWLMTSSRIAALEPNAVIFQYWLPFFAPAYGTIAGRLRKSPAKIIAVLHNVLPHERRPGDRSFGRYFLKRCDAFVSLSESVARDLRSLGMEGDLRVSPHPVYEHFGAALPMEEARRRLSLPKEAEVLLFFGFIRRYKGLHVLLEAMPQIIRRRPSVRLVVAGEFYEDAAKYREMIRTLNLDEHVQLHPLYIESERVGHFFSAADVVVQPYETATQSGVVQTAFHFEKPVVVTNVGGLAEVVPDGSAGLIVPPGDPSGLAAAVIRFFEEHLSSELAIGVRREKERYSWTSFIELVEELIG